MNKETARNVVNSVPYGLVYSYLTQKTSSTSRFHYQALGFMVCSMTWNLTNQFLETPMETPPLIHNIPEYVLSSEYYILVQKSISGMSTGAVYAIARKNNIFIFSILGGILGSLRYFAEGNSFLERLSMPIDTLTNHISWLNPVENLEVKELQRQYAQELKIVQSTKTLLQENINELTKRINSAGSYSVPVYFL